jgi:hypothetical protein
MRISRRVRSGGGYAGRSAPVLRRWFAPRLGVVRRVVSQNVFGSLDIIESIVVIANTVEDVEFGGIVSQIAIDYSSQSRRNCQTGFICSTFRW